MTTKLEVTDVFTPRNSNVNLNMYIHRPELEKSLLRSVKRNTHTLVFGESGNGKSWLYKKVLDENNIPYVVVNCANASRRNSITEVIYESIIPPGTAQKLGYDEDKKAEVNAVFAKGALNHSAKYELSQEEPLLRAFKHFNSLHSQKKIIVLDNLESIFDSAELMDELANIIILLDDSAYSENNVNLLIVGVPNDVLHYYRATKNLESVANRITEARKVESLDFQQVYDLIKKGFELLEIDILGPDLMKLTTHIYSVTLGIAQRVHEYGEHLAYAIQDNDGIYETKLIENTDFNWLIESFRQTYQVIEEHLNSRETTVARRNQVIFCIAKIMQHQFDSNDVERLIREEFPETIANTNMGIGAILATLSRGEKPLLNRNSKNNNYSVRDARYIMCIKLMLSKKEDSSGVSQRKLQR